MNDNEYTSSQKHSRCSKILDCDTMSKPCIFSIIITIILMYTTAMIILIILNDYKRFHAHLDNVSYEHLGSISLIYHNHTVIMMNNHHISTSWRGSILPDKLRHYPKSIIKGLPTGTNMTLDTDGSITITNGLDIIAYSILFRYVS